MGSSPFLGGRWEDVLLLPGAQAGGPATASAAVYRGGLIRYELVNNLDKEIPCAGQEIFHGVTIGSNPVLHVHWQTSSADATGGVIVWGYEIELTNPANDSVPVYLTGSVNQTVPAGNRQYLMNSFDLVTITTGAIVSSTIVSATLRRVGSSGSDTYIPSVFPSSFALHVQLDTVGSNGQNTKN